MLRNFSWFNPLCRPFLLFLAWHLPAAVTTTRRLFLKPQIGHCPAGGWAKDQGPRAMDQAPAGNRLDRQSWLTDLQDDDGLHQIDGAGLLDFVCKWRGPRRDFNTRSRFMFCLLCVCLLCCAVSVAKNQKQSHGTKKRTAGGLRKQPGSWKTQLKDSAPGWESEPSYCGKNTTKGGKKYRKKTGTKEHWTQKSRNRYEYKICTLPKDMYEYVPRYVRLCMRFKGARRQRPTNGIFRSLQDRGLGLGARLGCSWPSGYLRDGIDQAVGSLHGAALPQDALPQLHADDPEDEEDKEAEQQDIAQHGQRVQQQHHQDPHAFILRSI